MLTNILAEMGRNRLTYKDLYQLLDVSAPTLRGYLSGEPIPSDKLKKMSVIFNRTTDYLLEDMDCRQVNAELMKRIRESMQQGA
jgi:Helix-turn-helix.